MGTNIKERKGESENRPKRPIKDRSEYHQSSDLAWKLDPNGKKADNKKKRTKLISKCCTRG